MYIADLQLRESSSVSQLLKFIEIVESNDVIRNIAKMINLNISYNDQLSSVINKTTQKAARVNINFSTKKVDFLHVMYRSLIQCH